MSKNKSQKSKLLLITGILSFVAVIGVYAFIKIRTSPQKTLMQAVDNLENSSSFQMNYQAPEDLFSVNVSYFDFDLNKNENKLGEISLTANNMNNDQSQDLSLAMKFNKNVIYLQGDYSQADDLLTLIQYQIPSIGQTQTVTQSYEIMTGQKWLQINTPDDKVNTRDTESQTAEKQKNEEFANKLKDCLVLKQYDKKHDLNGLKVQKVSFGIDKKQLLAVLNELKNYDIDMKLQDLNRMIRVVDSIENWDQELIIMYISQDHYLRQIDLFIPQVEKEAIELAMQEQTTAQETGINKVISEELGNSIANFFNKNQDEKDAIGSIYFTDYDKVKSAEYPNNTIDGEIFFMQAMQDLGPIITQIMNQNNSSVPANFN